MSSKVKWQNECSDSFPICQGVRQGGILSPYLYKLYVNPLLQELKSNALGAHIGSIYTGTVAVADDFLFMSNCPHEMQTILSLTNSYSGERRYKIHPTKSILVKRLTTKKSKLTDIDRKWYIGESEIKTDSQTEHLGIIRSDNKENQLNIDKKLSLARRTLYSLMKTGLHGCNGINPKVSNKIYQVYVIPRLFYGLEVLPLNADQLHQLRTFHLEILKNIQSLPSRTANCVAYLLIGALPIDAELEKRQLNLYHSVATSENSTLQELSKRQSIIQNKESFFKRIFDILVKYNLPSLSEIQQMTKDEWKSTVKQTVREYWTEKLQEEAGNRSTLERCHIPALQVGGTHIIWETVQSCRMDVIRAATKVRMLTGTYLLQSHKKKFNLDGVSSSTCPLCCLEDEDIVHMLTRCPALNTTRQQYLGDIKQSLQHFLGSGSWSTRFTNPVRIVQLIVDCQKLVPDVIPENKRLIHDIETKARLFCFKLHLKRLHLLNNVREDSRGKMVASPANRMSKETLYRSSVTRSRAPSDRRRIQT